MVEILVASSQEQLNDARALMRAFVAWHRTAHSEDTELIDRYFDADGFAEELDGLPGAYAPPAGCLLVAMQDGRPAGCVAMRDCGDRVCEMKRMFVPEEFRGAGIGRALVGRIIAAARSAGYERMLLDTGKRQQAAMKLYESFGFRRIEAYYPLPDDMRNYLRFYALALRSDQADL